MGCLSSTLSNQAYLIISGSPFQYRLAESELRRFASFFAVRHFEKDEVISAANSKPEFIVIGEGRVEILYEGVPLASKGRGDFFGQIAVQNAMMLERKESLRKVRSASDLRTGGGLLAPPSPTSLNKRESGLDQARLSTAVARTPCLVAVLGRESLADYLKMCSDKLMELVTTTMGSGAFKNLSSLPFLQGISAKRLEVLSNMLHYVPLDEGEILFEEGSLGTQLYIVYLGACKAVVKQHQESDADGEVKEVVLNTFSEGDFFGEISLMMGMPRTATIVATEPSLLLELRKDDFQNFLKLTPNLPFNELMKRRFANHFKKYKVPFFSAIPEDKYPVLAALCVVEQMEPNNVIFREGEVGHTFYIIAHGQVSVTTRKVGKDGAEREIELCQMGPGKYFGEIALIRDTKRTATVKTITRCVILSITKENFEKFFQEAPEALADFEVKLARYDVAMRSVIYHPTGQEYLNRFLEQEYSAENIHFWKASRAFRHIPDIRDPAEPNFSSSFQDLPTFLQRTNTTLYGDDPFSSPPLSPLSEDEPNSAGSPRASGFGRALSAGKYTRQHTWSHAAESHMTENITDAELQATRAKHTQLTDETKERMAREAQAIYDRFIKPESEEWVNIKHDVRKKIETRLSTGEVDVTLFVAAEKEILGLIERDSFSRFKQSELFKEFLSSADTYDKEEQKAEIKESTQRDPKLRSGSVIEKDKRAQAQAEPPRRKSSDQMKPRVSRTSDASLVAAEQQDVVTELPAKLTSMSSTSSLLSSEDAQIEI